MLFRNGILSDKEFLKHFGKDIFIHPFNRENLKGASYNLTASPVAYYEENGKYVSSLTTKNKIMVKPGKITFIQTNESLYVSQRICGTYHTKVKWVSKGLSSISTTLDPCYFGTSLITVINLGKKDIEIDVNESLCTIIFQKMASGSKDLHDNTPGRKDVVSGRIYEFDNMLELKRLKEVNNLEEIEARENLEEKCKNCVLGKINTDECGLNKQECDIYKKYLYKKNIREQKIDEKVLEYKNYLEQWYEAGFRNQKTSLIDEVKESLRNKVSDRIKKNIDILLLLVYISVLIWFSKNFGDIEALIGDGKSKYIEILGYAILPIAIAVYPILSKCLADVTYKILNKKEI